MNPPAAFRRTAATFLVVLAVAAPVAAQDHETYTNLKVLPKDISQAELRGMMNGFTRALGVRCIFCHVGVEGQPFKPGAFALDDKPNKAKARVMIQMMRDLNEKYLTTLPTRSTPPVQVQCVTCHRGVTEPRPLEDVLKTTYDTEGLDSTFAAYAQLRGKYYGRASYDFGEVPLANLAANVHSAGHAADAESLYALNVAMNPRSPFAARQYAYSSLVDAFENGSVETGTAAYQQLKGRFGAAALSEEMVNQAGYDLLGSGHTAAAVAVLRLNADDHPASGNAFDSLGEAYMKSGDRKLAAASYTKSLALDPTNDNAKHMLDELKTKPKQTPRKKS